jgi:hypothetical protein
VESPDEGTGGPRAWSTRTGDHESCGARWFRAKDASTSSRACFGAVSMAAEGAERGRRFKGDMPPVLESSLSAITRVCRRSRVQLRASVILEDRGGEGRGREQVQVDDARRRGIRVIRRENTYSPISIATLSATPTTCSPRQGSKFLAKLQFSALSRSLQTWCS